MRNIDPYEEGLAAGEAVASAVGGATVASSTEGRMYVRTQGFGSTDAELRFLQRNGVLHKAARFKFHEGKGWDLDELIQERERHESFGIKLDMSSLPIYEHLPSIIYYGNEDRDRDIDLVCEMIRTASRAGIDSLRYNTCILPIDRTEMEEGRGGYFHTAFRLDKIPKEEQETLTDAGRVTAEEHWERIEYLLERMIPVAEEYKVRMGNSQEDPPTPPGYKGVDKVLNDFEGMKRFIEIPHRSPYHGWNFCVGSIAEMLEDPANEIYPFIEYFGSRDTIFLVHYRNLLGKRYSFREALPDEGVMDFYRVLKALKDTGYSYGIDPDHVPRTDDDPNRNYQSYAYCFGYINAMIQAVYA